MYHYSAVIRGHYTQHYSFMLICKTGVFYTSNLRLVLRVVCERETDRDIEKERPTEWLILYNHIFAELHKSLFQSDECLYRSDWAGGRPRPFRGDWSPTGHFTLKVLHSLLKLSPFGEQLFTPLVHWLLKTQRHTSWKIWPTGDTMKHNGPPLLYFVASPNSHIIRTPCWCTVRNWSSCVVAVSLIPH